MHPLLQEGSGSFLDWGIVHISVGNLVVIATMLVVFALAIVVPFPRHHDDRATTPAPAKGTSPGRGQR